MAGRKKLPEEKKKKTKVMRVSEDNWKKLTQLKENFVEESDLDNVTFDTLMDDLIKLKEVSKRQGIFYRAGSKIFKDIAEARGECIRIAVKENKAPDYPEILTVIGVDDDF